MRFVVLEINKSELQKRDINIWLKTWVDFQMNEILRENRKGGGNKIFFFFLFTFKNQLVHSP